MQKIEMNPGFVPARINKIYLLGFFLILLIAVGLALGLRKPPSGLPEMRPITASALEGQYGLRVNLVAVTGAGGFVDVRIKIVDGEKAKLLLADKNNFPAILANDSVILNAPDDTKSQSIIFDNNLDMFILYPNSSNIVKPGSYVRILFGDTILEPVDVLD